MKQKEIKQLWAKAAGRCSFSDCREILVENEIILGEQAHIIANNFTGPRGGSDLNRHQRNQYNNLILFCPIHHTLVDKRPDKYPVEKLKQMKQEHEEWVDQQLSSKKTCKLNLNLIHYLNIPRLEFLFLDYNMLTDDYENIINFISNKNSLSQYDKLPQLMLKYRDLINNINLYAINVDNIESDVPDLVGAIINFNINFRTKNLRNYKNSLTGDLHKDPLIYSKQEKYELILPIDPTWITTETAKSSFCSGISKFAGLAIVKTINYNKSLICTPLILGTANNSDIQKILDNRY